MNLEISHYILFAPLLFCVTASFYYCLAIYAALDYRSQSSPIDLNFHPPISLLKPLCGLDSRAYENLASFCCQDYSDYQIVFGVQDATDPAVKVVKQLMNDFPKVDIQLVISDRTIGTNLKISNLANAATAAKHSILLISDSDIQVDSDYLMQVVQPLSNPAIGVVTCIYRSLPQGWIAAFEALGIATELSPTVFVARKLESMKFGIGATVVIQKSALDAIGGFSAIANYLHDDFHLGNMPAKAGYEVVLSSYVVNHVLAAEGFFAFIRHQTRWNRGIRVSQPLGYAGQIFTFGTVASLCLLLTTRGSALSWLVLSAVWCCRFTMAWLVGVKTLNDPTVKKLLWLVPLSDLMRFVLWCYSFVGNTVEWRGHQFRLTKGGKLLALTVDSVRVEASA